MASAKARGGMVDNSRVYFRLLGMSLMTSGQLPQHLESESRSAQALLEPNYQNRLRAIGRALDENELHQMVVIDNGDELFLRAYAAKQGEHVTDTFTSESLIQTLRLSISSRGDAGTGPFRSPLRPTGYEDFLRALGHRLDERSATAIVIVECPQYFHVSGQEYIGVAPHVAAVPFAEMYEFPRINKLISEAAARRTDPRAADYPVAKYLDQDPPLRILRTGARLP